MASDPGGDGSTVALALGLVVLRALTGRSPRRADPAPPPSAAGPSAATGNEPLDGQRCFVGGERDADDGAEA